MTREKEDNGYAKFWSVNKVPYGLCENSEWLFFHRHLNHLSSFSKKGADRIRCADNFLQNVYSKL